MPQPGAPPAAWQGPKDNEVTDSLPRLKHRNPDTPPKKVRGAGFPMVNMGELFAHPRIHRIKMDLVPVDQKEHHYLLAEGDLLFARQSLVLSGAGQCSIFMGNAMPTVFESHLIRCRLDTKRSNPLFYFYFFRSPEGRRAIEAIVEQGAGASGIRGSDLINLQVPSPPKELQDHVATTLGALDDRITLLRETNATLEAIAQALFKSWFVDFDPVRAKMAGRAPEGMDEATAALFPDALEETELGFVPKGWAVARLTDAVECIFSGGTPDTRRPEFWGGGIPWFSSGETRNTVVTQTEKTITPAGVDGSSTRAAMPGDVLIASAGQGHTRGQTSYCGIDCFINQSVVAVRAGKKSKASWLFFNLRRRYEEMRNLSDSHSSRGSLTTKLLAGMPVVVPSSGVLAAFDDVVSTLISSVISNELKAGNLAALRDSLLPRLISGQLRLPEAQAQLEGAFA